MIFNIKVTLCFILPFMWNKCWNFYQYPIATSTLIDVTLKLFLPKMQTPNHTLVMQLNIKLLRERNKRKNCLRQWTASLPKSFQSTCSCRCRKRNEMKNKFDSFSGRYTLVKIFVTLDLPFQKSATKAIDRVGVIIAERFLKNNLAIPDLLFYIFVFSLKFLNAAYGK